MVSYYFNGNDFSILFELLFLFFFNSNKRFLKIDDYQKIIILSGMKAIEDQTRTWKGDCIKFVPYKTGDPHFIRIKHGNGCTSEVKLLKC